MARRDADRIWTSRPPTTERRDRTLGIAQPTTVLHDPEPKGYRADTPLKQYTPPRRVSVVRLSGLALATLVVGAAVMVALIWLIVTIRH